MCHFSARWWKYSTSVVIEAWTEFSSVSDVKGMELNIRQNTSKHSYLLLWRDGHYCCSSWQWANAHGPEKFPQWCLGTGLTGISFDACYLYLGFLILHQSNVPYISSEVIEPFIHLICLRLGNEGSDICSQEVLAKPIVTFGEHASAFKLHFKSLLTTFANTLLMTENWVGEQWLAWYYLTIVHITVNILELYMCWWNVLRHDNFQGAFVTTSRMLEPIDILCSPITGEWW